MIVDKTGTYHKFPCGCVLYTDSKGIMDLEQCPLHNEAFTMRSTLRSCEKHLMRVVSEHHTQNLGVRDLQNEIGLALDRVGRI